MAPALWCAWLLVTISVPGRAGPAGRIVEGDIFIEPPQVGKLANPTQNNQVVLVPGDSDTWTTREIPYILDSSLDPAAVPTIQAAMTDISLKTAPPGGGLCLTFREATPADLDSVKITGDQRGCFSSVGRRGGQQILNVGSYCNAPGVIQHELLHALGFWHEQSRADRDTYVHVLYDNIILGNEQNFAKKGDMSRHVLPYDFDSILHYKYNEFARSPDLDTILPLASQHVDKNRLGQRQGLSDLDIQRVKWLYQCDHSYFCTGRDLPDGDVTPVAMCYGVGHQVRASCKDNHVLIGPAYSHCKANGQWSGAPPYCLDQSTTAGRRLLHCDMEPDCVRNKLPFWRGSTVWTLHKGPTLANGTGPHTDHTTDSSSGSYLLWDATTVTTYTRANLYSPVQVYSGDEGVCVLLYYHLEGAGMAVPRMYMYMKYSRRTAAYMYRTAYRRVWSSNGQTSREWQVVYVCPTPPSNTARYQVIIYVYRGKMVPGQTADVAIDDVMIGPRALVTEYKLTAERPPAQNTCTPTADGGIYTVQ